MKQKEKETKVSAQIVLSSITKTQGKNFNKLASIKKIKTQDDFDSAGLAVKQLKEAKKIAEEKQQEIVGPLEKAIEAVKSLFAPFYTKVDEAEQRIKDEIKLFAADRKQKLLALENKVKNGKLKDISKYAEQVAELTIVNTSASVRNRWTAEIVDESKIPRAFMMPDSKKITEHLRKVKLASMELEHIKNTIVFITKRQQEYTECKLGSYMINGKEGSYWIGHFRRELGRRERAPKKEAETLQPGYQRVIHGSIEEWNGKEWERIPNYGESVAQKKAPKPLSPYGDDDDICPPVICRKY